MILFDKIWDYLERMFPSRRKPKTSKSKDLDDRGHSIDFSSEDDIIHNLLLEEQLRIHLASGLPEGIRRGWVSPFRRAATVAALLMFFLVCTGWYANSHATNDALVEYYFDPPNMSSTRGGIVSGDLLTTVKEHFMMGDYESCISMLSNVEAGAHQYEESLLISGFTYLKLHQPADAIHVFTILHDSSRRDDDRIEWHLLLAYLQSGNIEEVNSRLGTILSSIQHDYKHEAQQLNNCLDSIWRKMVL